VFDGIRQNWRVFIRSEPGRRFEERYRYSQQSKRGPAKRVVWLSAGIVLVVLGLFFLVAPGPGILFLLPGAALVSQEWLSLARALDRGEAWLRKRLHRRQERKQ
jgi:hypothetical protein